MITLPTQKLSSLLALFFCSLVTFAQAGESASPASPEAAVKSAPSSPAVTPSPTIETVQQPSQLFLSRGYAVAMAVYRNLDLRIEAQNFKMSEIDLAKSWGIYNPVFNASGSTGVTAVPGDAFFSARTSNASLGLTQNLPIGGSISASTQTGYFSVDTTGTASKDWQSTAGLNVTLPLLKNAGRQTVELSITVADNTQQESLERFRASTIDTVSNVITNYNHLYVLRQAQETKVAALNSAQKLMDGIKQKASTGPVQGLELANADFAIAQRRKDLVEASRSVKDQEVSLRYLIGLDVPTQIIPSDPPSKVEPLETDEQAVKAALEHRSDLRQLQLSLKTALLQERVAHHQLWPELSVNAGGGLTGSGYKFNETYQQIGNHPGTFWNVGAVFSMPLGNTTARNDYRRSSIRTEQIGNQINALSWKIRNDVESDMRALISARLQIQLSDRSGLLAEQRLEEYRKNNQLGSATIQDVLNAENDRNVAHNAQLEAVETFSNAVIKLWKDTGLLLDRHGIHIDTSHPDKLTESKQQNPALLVDPPPAAVPVTAPALPQVQAPSLPVVAVQAAVAASETVPAVPVKYTLTIGEYDSKSAMADAIKKIKHAGLSPVVKQGPLKTESMIRLFVADLPDQESARQELVKLHKIRADGFIMNDKAGSHIVYAGSYSGQELAENEQNRLAALGVKTELRKVSIPVATFMLTAGNFPTRKAAMKYAAKLEKLGLKAAITGTDK